MKKQTWRDIILGVIAATYGFVFMIAVAVILK